ncbi:glycine zipper 2TM domain-containing protein [Neptuniibacter sp. CAU 1671]|uniref:glycine zipper 2TM domain-containing protein n=1 Tax=Neptuniibacter sp. CAU 1671 TaxID=3032593 RepID=UPI0023D9DF99|nr:glycine zipper 2TM domain-containing protein [Neptuniibacter sp. CAU 1671]MDF2182009.1 glycine zipper 2TM domain-containing protein [Neptuniibacter sp. CAU 1671]
MKRLWMVATLSILVVLSGCANNLSGSTYSRNEARKVQTVNYGVVEAAQPVVIEGRTDGIVGTGAGAIIGGLAASEIGGGKGKSIATIIGVVTGGILGQNIEESATRAQGQELTVRLENGRVLSIVQEVGNGPFFRPGDRVRVLQHGSTARVTY